MQSGPTRLLRRGGVALVVSAVSLAQPHRAFADDRASAQAILATLDPASKDDAVRMTRDALERATRMQVAGDPAHARQAEGLALEWAELARDRARAEGTERAAKAAEVASVEAVARVEREQALLEEAITRSGRLKAELVAAGAKGDKLRPRDRTSPLAPGDVPSKPPPASAGATGRKVPAQGGRVGPPGQAPKSDPTVDADAPATPPGQGPR